jgi:hypothetical protein
MAALASTPITSAPSSMLFRPSASIACCIDLADQELSATAEQYRRLRNKGINQTICDFPFRSGGLFPYDS